MVVVPAVWCLVQFNQFNRSHLRIKNNNPHYAFSASATRARRASWIKEENSVYGLVTGYMRVSMYDNLNVVRQGSYIFRTMHHLESHAA